ncbi:hypothetical protein SCUCBS95973_001606 [Sporothrix curviconia]|uniref:Zn(2)-C6 fungal-type domain-containing protein n=1 Tax=Sporothrix curviconia TaxID=1260050 RepID=A0ABP0B080_9PEZI
MLTEVDRKKKCDGEAPSCRACRRLGLSCAGYGPELLWEDDARRDGMRRRGPRGVVRLPLLAWPSTSFPGGPLNAARALLWDQYIHRFCNVFPSYPGRQSPFFSVLATRARQSAMVLEALLAVSGAQTWGQTWGHDAAALQYEMLQAKQRALAGCRQMLGRLDGADETDGADDQLVDLLATAVLLLLHEKFCGAAQGNWQPHLTFINHVFSSTRLRRLLGAGLSDAHADPVLAAAVRFLHGLFTYNDLVASTSLRQPPLSRFYIDGLREHKTDAHSQYRFPHLIARISAGDTSLRAAEIRQWSGRMDWFPSVPATAEELGSQASLPSDQADIAELYRDAAMAYYEQQQQQTTPAVHSLVVAMRRVRRLPASSPWANALLWPISILAPHLPRALAAERQYVCERLDALERRFHMKQFSCVKQMLVGVWREADRPLESAASRPAEHAILQG